MEKKHFVLLFFVLLTFGFYFAVPAQDLPETACDESQIEPYEPAPLISGLTSGTTAPSEAVVEVAHQPLHEVPPHAVPKDRTGLPRPAAPHLVLSLLCTFLC